MAATLLAGLPIYGTKVLELSRILHYRLKKTEADQSES